MQIDPKVNVDILNPLEMISFQVNGLPYQLALDKLINFPIKNTLLELLYNKYLDNNTEPNNVIVVDYQAKYFHYVLASYENPQMSDLATLLNIKEFPSQLTTRLTNENEESIIESLPTNSVYNGILRESNLQELLQEFKYFGIYDLFASKPFKAGIDQSAIISDIEAKIDETIQSNKVKHSEDGHLPECNIADAKLRSENCIKFGCGHFVNLQQSERRAANRVILGYHDYLNDTVHNASHLLANMRRIGAILCGSHIIRSILGESWECGDLDMCVNIELLQNQIFCGYYNEASLHRKYPTYNSIMFSSDASPTNRRNYIIEIVNRLIKQMDLIFVQIVESDDLKGDGYATSGDLKFVLKFIYYGIKIDLVVVDCTPQYFVRYFDFNFLRVYYDGYTIHAFDWDSVLHKTSVNNCRHNKDEVRRATNNAATRYIRDLARIVKYTSRGFIISTADLETDPHDKN